MLLMDDLENICRRFWKRGGGFKEDDAVWADPKMPQTQQLPEAKVKIGGVLILLNIYYDNFIWFFLVDPEFVLFENFFIHLDLYREPGAWKGLVIVITLYLGVEPIDKRFYIDFNCMYEYE